MYTLGEPTGAVKKYLDWVHSDAGQKIVTESGYVPLPKTGAPDRRHGRTERDRHADPAPVGGPASKPRLSC